MTTRISLALGLALLLTVTAAGQSGTIRTTIYAPVRMEVVKGKPYSYEMVSESRQVLADGTHVSQPAMTTKVFQDASGRRRIERPAAIGLPAQAIVEIYDVVAGYRYVLDDVNKVAHRSAIPATRRTKSSTFESTVCPLSAPDDQITASCWKSITMVETRSAPQPDRGTNGHSLGTKEIGGLKCEGRLVSNIYPAGSMGNDRTLESTAEIWMSKKLNILVLSKSSDHAGRERISQIKNLSRAKPDPSLFQPPADYKVVDETGQFEITITLP